MDYSRIRRRMLEIIESYGEKVTVGTSEFKAFLQPLGSSTTYTYLDDTEASAVLKPGLFLIAGGEAAFAINDTMTRGGRIYTVRKIVVERLGNTPVLTFAVLS